MHGPLTWGRRSDVARAALGLARVVGGRHQRSDVRPVAGGFGLGRSTATEQHVDEQSRKRRGHDRPHDVDDSQQRDVHAKIFRQTPHHPGDLAICSRAPQRARDVGHATSGVSQMLARTPCPRHGLLGTVLQPGAYPPQIELRGAPPGATLLRPCRALRATPARASPGRRKRAGSGQTLRLISFVIPPDHSGLAIMQNRGVEAEQVTASAIAEGDQSGAGSRAPRASRAGARHRRPMTPPAPETGGRRPTYRGGSLCPTSPPLLGGRSDPAIARRSGPDQETRTHRPILPQSGSPSPLGQCPTSGDRHAARARRAPGRDHRALQARRRSRHPSSAGSRRVDVDAAGRSSATERSCRDPGSTKVWRAGPAH